MDSVDEEYLRRFDQAVQSKELYIFRAFARNSTFPHMTSLFNPLLRLGKLCEHKVI